MLPVIDEQRGKRFMFFSAKPLRLVLDISYSRTGRYGATKSTSWTSKWPRGKSHCRMASWIYKGSGK